MVRFAGLVLSALLAAGAGAQMSATAAGAASGQVSAHAAVSTMQTPAISPQLTTPVSQLAPEQIASMQKLLADFPQLARYKAENAKLGPPTPGQQRVVFYGDSITDNWGRAFGKFFPDKPWVNRGISGQTTQQMVLRLDQDVIALQPEAVVILAVTNDIAGNTGPETLDEIETNYRTMVQLALASHVRVVVASVLPASEFPWNKSVDPRDEIKALNSWLQQFAQQHGLVYVDYYSAMATPDAAMKPELAVDKYVHPNNAGYTVMEPLARAAVERALAQPRP